MKRMFKIPLNVQIDSDRINNPFWLKERKINLLYNEIAKWIVKKANSLRVMSSDVKKKLAMLGIREDKIWVVPTPVMVDRFEGIDVSLFRKQNIDKKFNKIVLFVGRLSPEKNVSLLLEAFPYVLQKNPSTLLLIIGSGKQEKELRDMASYLKIDKSTIFTSGIPNKKLPFYFASCDVFVLPSLHEGRANVLIEAALSKKPIIVTSVSGAKDWVIDNKTGFIINQMNCEQLVEKILFLLDNPKIAQKFGETGYNYVKQKLQETNEVNELIQCWEETAKIEIK